MKINIETVSHNRQRYTTVGDWYWRGKTLHIRVSRMSNWKREMAVAIHEMTEALWCKAARVSQGEVDKFDEKFEEERVKGDEREPGDQPEAPYFEGHQLGTKIEKEAFAAWNWAEYDREVRDL